MCDLFCVLPSGRVTEPHLNAGVPMTAFKLFEPYLEALKMQFNWEKYVIFELEISGKF